MAPVGTADVRERAKAAVRTNRVLWCAVRTLNRLRWPTKARLVRAAGASPRAHAGYILWDPEIESFSYELANEPELVAFCAQLFGLERDVVAAHLAELHADPELTTRLRRRTALRPWLRGGMAPGNRTLWYLLARIRRPELIVETGIYDGLGSLVLLRALERNAAEGSPGELVSVDSASISGELVPGRLRGRWTKLTGFSSEVLEPALRGRAIGLFFQDTPHTEVNQRAEFAIALRHAADPVILVEGSGGYCPTLGELADAVGVTRHRFGDVAREHFYTPFGQGVAVIGAEALARAPEWAGVRPAEAERPQEP